MKEVDTMLKRLCSLIALAPLALASFAGMPAEARDKPVPEDPDITEFLALNQPDLEAVESFSQNADKEQTETKTGADTKQDTCLLYTSPSPRDGATSRMPSSA